MSNTVDHFKTLILLAPMMAALGLMYLRSAWQVKQVTTTQAQRYRGVIYACASTGFVVWFDLQNLGVSQTIHLLSMASHDGTHFGWLPMAFILISLAVPLLAIVTACHVYYRPALLKSRRSTLESCRFVKPERAAKEEDIHSE